MIWEPERRSAASELDIIIIKAWCRGAGANPPPSSLARSLSPPSSPRINACHQHCGMGMTMSLPRDRTRAETRYRVPETGDVERSVRMLTGDSRSSVSRHFCGCGRYQAGIPAREQTSGTWEVQGARTVLSQRPGTRWTREEEGRGGCAHAVHRRTHAPRPVVARGPSRFPFIVWAASTAPVSD